MKNLILLLLLSQFLFASTYTMKEFTAKTIAPPPANLLSLFSSSNKDFTAIKARYDELATSLKLKNVFKDIHNEAFYEAYISGFIDRTRILELTKETLIKMREIIRKSRGNARFSVTFFHNRRRVATDIHEQANFIAISNNKRYNAKSLAQYIIANKLLDKFFPEFSFLDKNFHTDALAYNTFSIRMTDPAKYASIIKEFAKSRRQRKHFDDLLEAYKLCESHWYKSIIRIFQNEQWIPEEKTKVSIFDLVNKQWNNILKISSPQIEQLPAPIPNSIAIVPFSKDFYMKLIIPTNEKASREWSRMYLSKRQFIFNETLKTWDKLNQKNQYQNLIAFSENAPHLFTKRKNTILYGFGTPVFALLTDIIITMNKIAFYANLKEPFEGSNNKITIYHDEFWTTGLALNLSYEIVKKLSALVHPFIEYWFLINVLQANNMEKFIFCDKILKTIEDKFPKFLQTTPTTQHLFKDKEASSLIFKHYNITNPVYSVPESQEITWPSIQLLKNRRKISIIVEDEKQEQENDTKTDQIKEMKNESSNSEGQ